MSINKSYQRLNGEDLITTPKTEKSNRVITCLLYTSLQGCVEIVCLVRPFLRPQEHTADDLSGHHLQGLTMPLIHGE